VPFPSRSFMRSLWNRFFVDFPRAHPLWATRGFFAESAWNFLMKPIRDIACPCAQAQYWVSSLPLCSHIVPANETFARSLCPSRQTSVFPKIKIWSSLPEFFKTPRLNLTSIFAMPNENAIELREQRGCLVKTS